LRLAVYQWLPFGGGVAIIYLTTPWVRAINDYLVSLAGPWVVLWLALALAGGGVVAVAAWLRISRPQRLAGRCLALGGVGAGSGLFVLATRSVPAETIHLIEYGLLAWPAVYAASRRREGGQVYLRAWAAVIVVGVGDEILQGFLPNRVCDLRDMIFNALAGGLGLAMLGLVLRYRLSDQAPEARKVER